MRKLVLAVLVLVLAAPSGASDPAWLIHVPRTAPDDLARLRGEGLPVVLELSSGLVLRGGPETVDALRALGRDPRVIDPSAGDASYLLAGLRPDSDEAALRAAGPVVLESENLLLIRMPRGASWGELAEARAFLTTVPETPVEPGTAPQAAEAAGDGTPNPLVQKIVASVSNAQIDQFWTDLTVNAPTGTRYSTAPGCQDSAAYCKAKMESFGLAASYQSHMAGHAPNVIGVQEGAVTPGRVWIVEGHLDDLPSSGPAPGADDNASGTVNVLESARVMSCWAFRDTVKYLAVTGEEFGLYGSEAYADDAWARGEDVRGVINMDMIAWAGDGNPAVENLDLNYNAASQWLGLRFAEAATTYATGLSVDAFSCPSLTASDHYPFWQKGWSAVCGITDNEGYCGHGGNYPHYHTSNDTIANCGDRGLFRGTVRTSVATLAELAGPFKIGFDRGTYACDAPALTVLVGDRDLDTDAGSAQTVAVEIWSDTETSPETITLAERTVHSMIFQGSIPTTTASPVHGDGLLSVSPNDGIHARYVDALDCDGAAGVTYVAAATVDCALPLISGVESRNVTDVSAQIAWATDEPATSRVVWGETRPPAGSKDQPGLVTSHGVPLTGLQACTTYWYGVESADEAGNLAVDDNAGAWRRFETYGNFGSGLQPCHAGRALLDRDTYACSGSAGVRVTDMDLNRDGAVAETVLLAVSSSTETVPETVTAVETGPNTSTFVATIPLAAGTAASDGVLQVSGGDTVTVTYRDADDGSGSPAVSFDTAAVDCGGPSIRNLRLSAITDQRVTIQFETDEPGDTVVEWGTTPALGQTASAPALVTAHTVLLNRLDLCGPLYLRARSTDALGNAAVADLGGQPFAARTWDIPGLYFRATFENGTPGWTLSGDFQSGPPQGLGGSGGNPDPAAAYNNAAVLGNDLTGLGAHAGDYEHSTTSEALTPEFDASAWLHTKLMFTRRLNVMRDDRAAVLVLDGAKETPVWGNTTTLNESGWTAYSQDISALADGKRRVKVRFRLTADAQGTFTDDGISSGWNVDDVVLKDGSRPDFAPCGACGLAPSFAGARAARDLDACGTGGVEVAWEPAVAWGTGGGGTYAVHRSETPGFTPSAANRVAAGVAGLAYVDASAPADRVLHYLVLAENDETCSTGPANGGLVDGNRRYAAVEESTSRPIPGAVDGVTVTLVNRAHVRLSWAALPGAASYRVYRADAPSAGPVLVGTTSALSWEDLGEGANAANRYYTVVAVNACGAAGP